MTAAELAVRPDKTILVDIRTAPEWQQTGVIEGAHLLTFFDARGEADPVAWMDQLEKIASPDDDLVLICRSGARTGVILNFLHRQTDYTTARHLDGGMLGWLEKGMPVVSPVF